MTIHTHWRSLLAAHVTLTSGALCSLIALTPALAAAPAAVQLADPVLFTHGDPTDYEQYLLELVNRARADPAAGVARLGIDLNQGLPPGSITADPKPPLALQPQLIDAARAHSQWMLDTDTFSHTGVDDTTPGDRMTAAGYPFTGDWTWGENIAWQGTTGRVDLTVFTAALHDGWVKSPGHRKNLLNPDFDEIGTGLLTGQFTEQSVDYNALMGTQAFARSDGTPGPLLLGVVYDDANDSGGYEPGEGVGGVTVQPTGSNSYAVTASAGGYAVPYNGTGNVTVIFSGAALAGTVTRSVATSGENVKLDLVLPVTSQYRLSVSVAGAGIVTSADHAITCGAAGADCTADYAHGSDVTLIATPATGYHFVSWGGACVGSGTCRVTLTESTAVVAQFAQTSGGAVDRSGFDWQVTEIYIATLGYAPDNDGLQYWVNNLNTSAWTPTEVAQSFFDNETVQALYPAAQGNELLIDALYQNIFGRAPDAAGQTYWLGQLKSGAISRNQMIIALINGGWANPDAVADMARFGNMIEVGLAFAAAQAERGISYAQLNPAQQMLLQQFGRQVVVTVTAAPATRDAAIASIPALLATL